VKKLNNLNTAAILVFIRKRYEVLGLGGEVLANALRSMKPFGAHFAGKDPLVIAKSILANDMSINQAERMNIPNAYRTLYAVMEAKIKHLESFRNPKEFGINIEWRPTQKEGLERAISLFKKGYTALAFQLPTGIGKTNLLAAINVAHHRALIELGLTTQTAIYTSNIDIGEQMVKRTNGEEGDLTVWSQLAGDNGRKLIRLLIGKGRSKSSEWINPDGKTSVFSYDGIHSDKTIADFQKRTKLSLQAYDEFDCSSEAFLTMRPDSISLCLSATMGDKDNWTPFEVCDPVISTDDTFFKPGHLFLEDDRERAYLYFHWQRYIGLCVSMREGVERGDQCGVRGISLNVFGNEKARQTFIDLTEEYKGDAIKAAREILCDVKVLTGIIKSVYLDKSDEFSSYLRNIGRPLPCESTALIYVQYIEVAQKMEEAFNTIIRPLVKQAWGVDIEATAVWGDDSPKSYKEKRRRLDDPNDPLKVIFSVKKIGRGVDIPQTDLILPLLVFTPKTARAMYQMIGRGTRLHWYYSESLKKLIEKDLLLIEVNTNLIPDAISPLASVCDMASMPVSEQPGSLLLGVPEKRRIELRFNDALYQEGISIKEILIKMAEEFKEDMKNSKFKNIFMEFSSRVETGGKPPRPEPGYGIRKVADVGIRNLVVLPMSKVGSGVGGKKAENPISIAQLIIDLLYDIKICCMQDLLDLGVSKFSGLSCGMFGDTRRLVRHILDVPIVDKDLSKGEFAQFMEYLEMWDFPKTREDMGGSPKLDLFLDRIERESLEINSYEELHTWLRQNYGTKPSIDCPKIHKQTRGVDYYPASLSCVVILKNGDELPVNSGTFNHINRNDALNLAARNLLAKVLNIPEVLTIEDEEFIYLAKEMQRHVWERNETPGVFDISFSNPVSWQFGNNLSALECEFRFGTIRWRVTSIYDNDSDPVLAKVRALVQIGAWFNGCRLSEITPTAASLKKHVVSNYGYTVVNKKEAPIDLYGLGKKYAILSLDARIECEGLEVYVTNKTGVNSYHALAQALDEVHIFVQDEYMNLD